MANVRKTVSEKLQTWLNRQCKTDEEKADVLLTAVNFYRKNSYQSITDTNDVDISLRLKLKDFYKEVLKISKLDDDLFSKNLEVVISTLLLTFDEFEKRKSQKNFIGLFSGMLQLAAAENFQNGFSDFCISCQDYPKCFKIFEGDMKIEINEMMSEKQIFINLYSFFVKNFHNSKDDLIKLWKTIQIIFSV